MKKHKQTTKTRLKLLITPALAIVLLLLPPYFAVIFAGLQLLVLCLCKISLKKQFSYLKPILFYGLLLFVFQGFSNPFPTVFFLLRFIAIMQGAVFLFETTSYLQIRQALPRSTKPDSLLNIVSETLFLFLIFIPLVQDIWQQSKKAWLCRGGKKNLRMFFTLLPVLFFVGMKKAWNLSRAIEIRK